MNLPERSSHHPIATVHAIRQNSLVSHPAVRFSLPYFFAPCGAGLVHVSVRNGDAGNPSLL